MIAWLLWLIIPAAIVLIALLKGQLQLVYKNERFSLRIMIGPVVLYDNTNNINRSKNETGRKARAGKTASAQRKQKQSWLPLLIDHWQELMELLGRVLTAPCLDEIGIHAVVGSTQPDEAVLRYGKTCAMIGALIPPLENTFVIKKRNINICPSFDDDKLRLDVVAKLSLRVYKLLALAICLLKMGLHLYRHVKFDKKVV